MLECIEIICYLTFILFYFISEEPALSTFSYKFKEELEHKDNNHGSRVSSHPLTSTAKIFSYIICPTDLPLSPCFSLSFFSFLFFFFLFFSVSYFYFIFDGDKPLVHTIPHQPRTRVIPY